MDNSEMSKKSDREFMMLNDPVPKVIIKMAGSMLAVGANSYIARLLGAHNRERAAYVLFTSFFVALAFGFIILVLGTIFMHPMVRILGATDTCEQYAVQYATYVLLVAPFMATSFVMNQCLRAEGRFQPVAGFNWGAKSYNRVMECYRFAARTAITGAVAMGLTVGLAANPIIRLFSETDPNMQQIGALILATARQGSCFFPIIFPLSMIWGANGVASVQALADVLSLLLAVPIIRRILKTVREAMEEADDKAEKPFQL